MTCSVEKLPLKML